MNLCCFVNNSRRGQVYGHAAPSDMHERRRRALSQLRLRIYPVFNVRFAEFLP